MEFQKIRTWEKGQCLRLHPATLECGLPAVALGGVLRTWGTRWATLSSWNSQWCSTEGGKLVGDKQLGGSSEQKEANLKLKGGPQPHLPGAHRHRVEREVFRKSCG